MDDLPNELIVMILRELSLIDLVGCRLVSKRFRSLVDGHFKFRELVAFENDSYDDLAHFQCTVEPFDCKHYFQPSHTDFLESTYFEFLFSNLRCLAIDCELWNLESLNKFANLERLQLHRLTVVGRRTLSLKKLTNLTILNLTWMNSDASLLVDSDSLEKLYCDTLEFIRFVRPETLRHLLIEEYSDELAVFRNLETLKINGTYLLTEIKLNLLTRLTSLSEIHLKCDGLLLDTEPLRLLADYIVQWTDGPKIFIYGIKLARPFDDYEFDEVLNSFAILQKQFDNYQTLGTQLNYQTKLDYGDLLECCPDRRLPNDLITKFSNIRILSAGPILDPDQFIGFLNSCRNLIDLELNVTGLDRAFFERFALNLYTLNFLILKGDLNYDPNYKFCGRLLNLWKVEIYQNLEFEFVFDLVKRLKYLRQFSFKQNGEQLIIGRTSKNCYYLERFLFNSMVERTGLSFDQLVELCNLINKDEVAK